MNLQTLLIKIQLDVPAQSNAKWMFNRVIATKLYEIRPIVKVELVEDDRK
jgi:hypothetical protein